MRLYVCMVTDKADRDWADTLVTDDVDETHRWVCGKVSEIVKSGNIRTEPKDKVEILRLCANGQANQAVSKLHVAQERFSLIVDNVEAVMADPSRKIAKFMAAKAMYEVLNRINAVDDNRRPDTNLRRDIDLAIRDWEKAK